MMNETVYLFALSLPALLARIVADPAENAAPVILPPSTGEPAKGSALDIPAEPLAGCQYLLARSARLGPLCRSQRVQNSRNEPHSGPIVEAAWS